MDDTTNLIQVTVSPGGDEEPTSTARPSSTISMSSVSVDRPTSAMSSSGEDALLSPAALTSGRNSAAAATFSNPPMTTTISTIAMQSGKTRLVIALLQNREWLQLKVLEMDPYITVLGNSVKEASEMLSEHEEVVRKLQSKQSPVEELLRQADQLIASQRPRAEVYSAMADSLGQAWKDMNFQLEQRRLVLNSNVTVLRNIETCYGKINQVEQALAELSGSAESCKDLALRTKSVRKIMLSSFLVCLEEGQALMDKLESLKTLDSRPDSGLIQAKFAISQVERWLEKLHDRRNTLDTRFIEKQDKLKEEIAMFELARELEQVKAALAEKVSKSSVNHYGTDASSARRIATSAAATAKHIKELREKVFNLVRKIDKTNYTHVSVSKFKEEAFQVIDKCSKAIGDFEDEIARVNVSREFFVQFEEAPKSLEGTLEPALEKGHKALDLLGWDNPKASGVLEAYRDLQERQKRANQARGAMEEQRQKQALIDQFHSECSKVQSYLAEIELSIKQQDELRPTRPQAEQQLTFLRETSNLLRNTTLPQPPDPPEVPEAPESPDPQGPLRDLQVRLTLDVDHRINLCDHYLQALDLLDSVNSTVHQSDPSSPEVQAQVAKFESFCTGFFQQCLLHKNQEQQFTPFQTELACDHLKHEVSSLSARISSAFADLQKAATAAQLEKEEEEEINRRVLKAISSAEEVMYSAYPILPDRLHVLYHQQSEEELQDAVPAVRIEAPYRFDMASAAAPLTLLVPSGGAAAGNNSRSGSFSGAPGGALLQQYQQEPKEDPSLKRIETSFGQVETSVQALEKELKALADHKSIDVEKQTLLAKTLVDLSDFFENYKFLSVNMTTVLKNLGEIDTVIHEELARNPMETADTTFDEVNEILKLCRKHAEDIVSHVREMEPTESAKIEQARLLAAIDEKRGEWDDAMRRKAKAITARDLQQIEKQLADLQKHLEMTRGQYGDNLTAARDCSTNFAAFEETIQILGGKIEKFIQNVGDEMRGKAALLKENWTRFLQMTKERRRLIDLSCQYFTLVNEAETWFKDGSKLLTSTARKSSGVKSAEEAEALLAELQAFVKPGEKKQEERISRVSTLAGQLYGEEKRKLYDAMMIKENKEILDSLNSMNKELTAMAQNLRSKIVSNAAGTVVEQTAPLPPSTITVTNTVEKVITKELNTSMLERIVINNNGSTPLMMEKQTQSVASEESPITRLDRDTVTQTVDEKLYEKETQTEKGTLPPAFTSPLTDIAINEGEKIRFQCVVAGKPEPNITWLKDGLVVTESNSDYRTEASNGVCSLTIDETFAEDSSIFTCRAANEAGVADTSAKLVVKETTQDMLSPPKFEVPLPTSTKLIEGTVNHQMSCLVRGNPLPTVEWFKNDENIDTCADYIITFNNGLAVLKFGEVILEDEGVYTCRAANKAGEAESSSELLVEARSIRFLEPLSRKMMARTGHKLRLECRTNVSCEFEWYHENRLLKDNIQCNNTSSVLVIDEAFAKDAGHYSVVAKNPKLGENKSSCIVSVKGRLPNETSDSEFLSNAEPVKPRLKMALQDTQAKEGEKIRLDCVIVGEPEPEVIWYHNGKPVKEGKDFQLVFRGDKCSLIIRSAVAEDAGEYRVTAVNSAGEVTSACKLDVLTSAPPTTRAQGVQAGSQTSAPAVPPKFSELIQDTMVNEGDQVTFKCAISEGNPKPVVKWFKNAVEIKDQTSGYSISSTGNDNQLKILSASSEHRGNYMAKAVNEAGEVKCFACLIVKGPLGEVVGSPTRSKTEVTTETLISSVVTKKMSFQHSSGSESTGSSTGSGESKDDVVSVKDRAASFNKDSPTSETSTSTLVLRPRPPVAPRFISPLTGIMADEGASITIEGQIDGYPDPHIRWTRNDQDFNYEPNSKYVHGKIMLDLRSVKITDGGRYACIAENDAGIATSVCDLVIKKKTFPPVFGKRLQAQTIQKGKRIYMEVEVIGTPAPRITWFKDAKPIDVNNEEYQFRTEGQRHILVAPNASREKSGQYMVKASNEVGNAQSIADVIVIDEQRKSPVNAVIFESTIGVSEELGVPKPITLIYETRASEKPRSGSFSQITTNTCEYSSSKSIPMILKTQPTIPSSEFVEPSGFSSRRALGSPRRVASPIAVRVDSISVSAEPIHKKRSKSTSEEFTSKSVKSSQFTSEQSSSKTYQASSTGPTIDVSAVTKPRGSSRSSDHRNTSTVTATERHRKRSDTTVPPAPQSTPESGAPMNVPNVPDNVLQSIASYTTNGSFTTKYSMQSSTEMTATSSMSLQYPDLVPGPPPEICYTPKTEETRRKSQISEKVKQLEKVRRNTSIPDIPGAVRILPPPDPPAEVAAVQQSPQPLRRITSVPPTQPETDTSSASSAHALVLEPFPFKADDRPTTPISKPPPPPKPTKFVPSEFRESDYESEFEGKIQPIWRPSQSPVPSNSLVSQKVAPPTTETLSQSNREPVKNVTKAWPPPEPQLELPQGLSHAPETPETPRRSVRDDVKFFETHRRTGKTAPPPEGVANEKIWSKRQTQSLDATKFAEPSGESVNYYVSTVSPPQVIQSGNIGPEIDQVTRTTYESSTFFESKTLEISDQSTDHTISPTVITDRGFKPSDAKKAWPAFLPDSTGVPKLPQPGWMTQTSRLTRTFSGPSPSSTAAPPTAVPSTESEPPKPGTPPQIGYTPFPSCRSDSPSKELKNTKISAENLRDNSERWFDAAEYHEPVYASTRIDDPSTDSQALALIEGPCRYPDVIDPMCRNFDEESHEAQTSLRCLGSTSKMTPHRRIPRFVPSKFVKRDFYESDYASDAEAEIRIRPKWNPAESDTDSEPFYRPIRAQLRLKKAQRPYSASDALEGLGHSFAAKAGKVAGDMSQEFMQPTTAYKAEKRDIRSSSQDPGLIYFKYDFGYEFGIVAPKEVAVTKEDKDSTAEGSVAVKIVHEKSSRE